MPPDDPIFPEGPETPKEPVANPNPAPTEGATLTMEAAVEMIQKANAPLLEQMAELGQTNQALAARINGGQNPQTPDPNPEGTPEDFLTQFSTDPKGAVRGEIREEFKTIAPLISTLMNSGASAFVGLEQQQIDSDFGPGAWAEHFERPMTQILDAYRQTNAAALADRGTIGREVNGLKGQLFDKLVTYREASRQKVTETQQGELKTLVDGVAGQVRSNLTGGIRRVDTGTEEVTEELKGYLAERKAAIGEENDPKEWLQRTDYGNTIDDYNAHQEELKKSSAKEKTA